jgi:hypothetical protein
MFFDGDLLSGRWSIGYHSDKTQSLSVVGDLLGNETGICAYGHLKTEADSSITRGDWLAPEMNSNYASYPEFAQELLDLAKSMTGGNLTPQVLAQHQYNRKKYSIANNPQLLLPCLCWCGIHIWRAYVCLPPSCKPLSRISSWLPHSRSLPIVFLIHQRCEQQPFFHIWT